MAGRHLKALIAAYRDKDDLAFRRAAQAIIEDEESKRHGALAQELRRMLASGSSMSMPATNAAALEPPRDRETDLPLADVRSPNRRMSDLVLPAELGERLDELIREVHAWQKLDAAGIPRRRSILLYGPPGCGKTSIAEAIAQALGRPLIVVKTEAVVSSYLGETASNLSRIFEFAKSGPFVVLFDEFDSIGKLREDPTDHGELRRVVNAVLQLIDRYSGPSLIVAATNHQDVLDAALWRRFSEVLEVPKPDLEMRAAILSRILMGRTEPDTNIRRAAEELEGLPHAASEHTAEDSLRLALLDDRALVSSKDLAEAVRRNTARRWM